MTAPPDEIFDRVIEWKQLVSFATSGGRGIAVVYGRRRQGKSFLLEAVVREHGGLYHQAIEEERVPALESFARSLAVSAGMPLLGSVRFADWSDAFRSAAEQMAGRPIVIDEFPYLLRKSPELPSAIQRAYDEARSGRHPAFTLFLCGSALSVMSELLIGQKALRGRATIDMVIPSFDFRVSRRFWGIDDPETAFLVNATIGGPPGYRDLLGGRVPADVAGFEAWLAEGILDPSHALFREAEYLLSEDPALADRALYQSLISAVARGASTRGGLANAVGRPTTALEGPLTQLERARMLYRDEDMLRARKPLVRIADPLIRFESAIIRHDRARFEARRTAEAWADAQPRFRSLVLGPHFETMARDWARTYASAGTLGGRQRRVGFVRVDSKDEGKGYELDVVVEAAGEKMGGRTRLIAIGEAKASDRSRTLDNLARLRRLRGELARRADVNGAKLLIFGRSGFDADLRAAAKADHEIELVDLERLYEGD
jgi:hypothetical protein